MKLRGFLGSGLLAAGLLTNCASEPRVETPSAAPPPEQVMPDPRNAEWLYALRGFNGSGKAECVHIYDAIVGEKACHGEACLQGSRLTEDWLRRCRAVLPNKVEEVSTLARGFNGAKKSQTLPCVREIAGVLNNGCGTQPNCRDFAQTWATRCADQVRSPLMIAMLESRVEEGLPESHPIKIDPRNCKALSDDLRQAMRCTHRFPCEDAVSKIATFKTRCLGPEEAPDPHDGMAELSIKVGAEQDVAPVAVAPSAASFTEQEAPVVLADGSGIVGLTCGARPKDTASYLELRNGCSDGEVVVLKRFAKQQQAEIRIGRFALSSDRHFEDLYPSLVVKSERESSGSAEADAVARELQALVSDSGASTGPFSAEYWSKVIVILAKHVRALSRLETAPAAFGAIDQALVPAFVSLAHAKADVAKSLFKPLEYATFLRRTLRQPLADLASDGALSVGAVNQATGLTLESVFPRAVEAYLGELGTFVDRDKKELNLVLLKALNQKVDEAVLACANAESKVLENEHALVECGFSRDCPPDKRDSLSSELLTLHLTARELQARAALLRLSLEGQRSLPLEPVADCREPWW